MFAAPGCLPAFSTSLITFKGKSHVTSALHSPTTSSSNCTTNTTVPAAIAMALIELLLLRHGRNLGLRSSHLSRWFYNIDIWSYECWVMSTSRTPRRVRRKHWSLFQLIDFVSRWSWCTLMEHYENPASHCSWETFAIMALPISVCTICLLILWSFLLKLFGLIAPQERWAMFIRKSTHQRMKLTQQQCSCLNKSKENV